MTQKLSKKAKKKIFMSYESLRYVILQFYKTYLKAAKLWLRHNIYNTVSFSHSIGLKFTLFKFKYDFVVEFFYFFLW